MSRCQSERQTFAEPELEPEPKHSMVSELELELKPEL